MDGSGVGVTDGPRGAAFDADGNLYLADFYSNAVYHYAYTGLNIADDDQKNVVADQYVLALKTIQIHLIRIRRLNSVFR